MMMQAGAACVKALGQERSAGRAERSTCCRSHSTCTAESGFLAEVALGPEDLEVVNSKGRDTVTC